MGILARRHRPSMINPAGKQRFASRRIFLLGPAPYGLHAVQAGPFRASRGASDPGHHEAVTVIVNADDPEAHRVDIMKLMLQAGVKAELSLQPNLARLRE